MPALWDSKVTFVPVSRFLGLALCSPFGSVCGPLVTPRLIVSLGGGKKERKEKNKPLADFKPVQQVLLVSLDATGKGVWALLFSLPMVLQR